ncbi:hypothetical protein D3870_08805 [Noviherbaspirillum cavernae]|uniref:MerR family transcriptional regulator n=1 Tax=Noviherbaspirillum cavernae TaxID=2320862 RepID=A0A418X0Z2_9BURK|nr:chaperone modulator CbpM [Noviherbaspirillum cavernae]RJG06092.1 hypothetical protein D3870_08805 [Noviherbaspirillum cavernae]
MMMQVASAVWLNETELCSIEYLAEVSGLSVTDIRDLVDIGAILPAQGPTDDMDESQSFHLRYVVTAKKARRLRDDFELDRHGVAVALMLLRRIQDLEAELQSSIAGGTTKR